jgi:hypothetical protein
MAYVSHYRNSKIGWLRTGCCLLDEEVTEKRKKVHGELRYGLYSLPNCRITIIKSRRIRWAKHVARVEGMKNPYECFKEENG